MSSHFCLTETGKLHFEDSVLLPSSGLKMEVLSTPVTVARDREVVLSLRLSGSRSFDINMPILLFVLCTQGRVSPPGKLPSV